VNARRLVSLSPGNDAEVIVSGALNVFIQKFRG
jgi:hypothetical protein